MGEPCLHYWQNFTGISLDFHSYGTYVKSYKIILCICVKDKYICIKKTYNKYKTWWFMLIQLILLPWFWRNISFYCFFSHGNFSMSKIAWSYWCICIKISSMGSIWNTFLLETGSFYSGIILLTKSHVRDKHSCWNGWCYCKMWSKLNLLVQLV